MKNTSCGWACLQSCKWGWVESFTQLRGHSWWTVSWGLVLWSHSRKGPLASSLLWVSKESHVVLFHQNWPRFKSSSASEHRIPSLQEYPLSASVQVYTLVITFSRHFSVTMSSNCELVTCPLWQLWVTSCHMPGLSGSHKTKAFLP